MYVEITSIQAAIVGRPSIQWTGTIEPSDLVRLGMSQGQATTDDAVNSALFRFFNRVDEADTDRLHDIGYELPSLSVGDLLTWGSKTWRVAGMGFDAITGSDEFVASLALYTAASMSGDMNGDDDEDEGVQS